MVFSALNPVLNLSANPLLRVLWLPKAFLGIFYFRSLLLPLESLVKYRRYGLPSLTHRSHGSDLVPSTKPKP